MHLNEHVWLNVKRGGGGKTRVRPFFYIYVCVLCVISGDPYKEKEIRIERVSFHKVESLSVPSSEVHHKIGRYVN